MEQETSRVGPRYSTPFKHLLFQSFLVYLKLSFVFS